MSPTSAYRRVSSKSRLNLPAAREKAGLSISQIAESTKISSRFLRAVEEESFGDLPGGIFTTSYIRQYAAAIGVDSDEILKVYYDFRPEAAPRAAVCERETGAKDENKAGWMRWLGVLTATSRS